MAGPRWVANCPAESRRRHSMKRLIGRSEANSPDAWLRDASSTCVCGHESEDNLSSSATPKSVPWFSSLHSHPTRRRIPHRGRKGPLFKDIEKLQAASSLVASRYTEIQAVPIGRAFLLGTIHQAFQSVKE